MKFKKIKRFLMGAQDVVEVNIEYINKSNEIIYYRNNEIYKLIYAKTKYDDYPVIGVYGYNADGNNGISIVLRCLEVDK